MAYKIDRAALWLLTVFSAFCLFMSITDGSLPLSVPASFMLILLLRLLLHKLPEKRLLRRSERTRRANALLHRWAIMDKTHAFTEIKTLLPDLYTESDWPAVQLIQKLPSSEAMSAGQLLDLWHTNLESAPHLFLVTGPVSSEAFALLPELTCPPIRVIDAAQLRRKIIPLIHTLPHTETKKERRRPFFARIAQFSRSIQPLRSGIFTIIFLILHMHTRSAFYLFSSLLFILQLTVCLIGRIISRKYA